MADNNTLGRRIREARLRRGFTQSDLAEHAGTTRNSIASIELGRVENPGVFAVYRIAKALHASMETLMGEPKRFEPASGFPTLVASQRALEARWADMGKSPGEGTTAAELAAFAPEVDVDQDDMIEAAKRAASVLDAVDGLSAEWRDISLYSTGALAMGIRHAI